MPANYTYPGVYVEEIPSGARTLVGVATSNTAFIDFFKKGPTDRAVQITTYGDFEREFGGLDTRSEASYAIRQYYANGGTIGWVIRVISGGASASAVFRLPAANGGATGALTVTASSPGLWGACVQVGIDHVVSDSENDTVFNMVVREIEMQDGKPVVIRDEVFRNVSVTKGHTRFIENVIKDDSSMVSVKVDDGDWQRPWQTGDNVIEEPGDSDFVPLSFLAAAAAAAAQPGGDAAVAALAASAVQTDTAAGDAALAVVAAASGAIGDTTDSEAVRNAVAAAKAVAAARAALTAANNAVTAAAAALDAANTAATQAQTAVDDAQTTANEKQTAYETATAEATAARAIADAEGATPDQIADAEAKEAAAEAARIEAETAASQLADAQAALEQANSDAATAAQANTEAVEKADQAQTAVTEAEAAAAEAQATNAVITAAVAAQTAADAACTASDAFESNYTAFADTADGDLPGSDEWNSSGALIGSDGDSRKGMYLLENIEPEIFNILCIPAAANLPEANMKDVYVKAIAYCEKKRAFLLVDIPESINTITEIKDWRKSKFTEVTRNAAVYFPRLSISDPLAEYRPRDVGASGTMAGVYARTDAARGIWVAPAGTEAGLRGAEIVTPMTDLENGQINPRAINALRAFPTFGKLSWGARTMKGDDQLADEYKYIPVRRLALYIEESLYQGLHWAVFAPNAEPLWAEIRLAAGGFMQDLFRKNAFKGISPKEAYFVKCDKETTTQGDIDRGIVNIHVGFAPLKPAEFVVIKLQQIAGQTTA